MTRARAAEPADTGNGTGNGNGSGAASEARLIARDDRKNPLISTFDWTSDAVQRVFRVPAGFMRNKTQERIEELAHERAVTSIDLTLVEEGIEIGRRMMAEMIATYEAPKSASAGNASPGVETATATRDSAGPSATTPETKRSSYLNEVSSHSQPSRT
jgi:hypothetical protein